MSLRARVTKGRSSTARERSAARRGKRSITFSSRRNARAEANKLLPIRTCPLCGSKRVHRRRITVDFSTGRSVSGVPADQCDACGEQFLEKPVEGLPPAALQGDAALVNRYWTARDCFAPAMTVRFTYRASTIRIIGAGYWRKGKRVYERENQIHERAHGKTEGRS